MAYHRCQPALDSLVGLPCARCQLCVFPHDKVRLVNVQHLLNVLAEDWVGCATEERMSRALHGRCAEPTRPLRKRTLKVNVGAGKVILAVRPDIHRPQVDFLERVVL